MIVAGMKGNTSLPLIILRCCRRRQDDAPKLGRVAACSILHVAVALAMLAGTLYASEPAEDWVRQVEVANALVDSGDLNQAEAVYTKALDHARTAGDDVRVGVVLQNAGRLLDRKGQQREAERAYLRAVHAFKRAAVLDDRLVIRAYVGLSAVYIQTGQYSKAETLIRRVLADHPAGAASDKASLMGSLGVILMHKQRFAEAEQVLRNTAQLCANTPGTEMQEVGAIAVANLAGLQMRNARTSEAIDLYRQAVAMMEAVPTPSPATLSATLADYAKAVRSAGDHQAAENLYRRAIALAETRLGQSHVILAGLLRQYAGLVRDEGRKSEARKLADAARRIESDWNRENLTGHTVEIDSLFVRR